MGYSFAVRVRINYTVHRKEHMAQDHAFWNLINKGEQLSRQEQCLAMAIVNLAACIYSRYTFEEIFDILQEGKTGFMAHAVTKQLNRMEELLMSTTTGLGRVQADQQLLKDQLTALQVALAASVQAQTDANTRLENDIAALRNLGGSGDEAALNAVADSMEQTLVGLKASTDALSANVTSEQAVDPVVVAITIAPTSASVVRTATVQFSASMPGTFKAASGSIDATGLYTPPTDTTILSDTVTATSADGTSAATASVSITG